MRLWTGLLALILAVAAYAYAPTPVQRSAAEQELTEALARAESGEAKLELARAALDKYPEDVVIGRAAQDVILRYGEDAVTLFKQRAEKSQSIAAHYLYARASDDTTVMAREAEWMLAKDPKNFWALQMAGIAEWSKAKPDLGVVERHLRASVDADPSRPEGYLNLGYLYEEMERMADARAAFEAGAEADPAHTGLRDARLTVYAELRDADAFFKLFEGIYPEQPLTADMPMAKTGARLTTEKLRGEPTVIEYWAYT